VTHSVSSDTFVAVIGTRRRGAMSDKSNALRAKSNDVCGMPITQPEGLGRSECTGTYGVGH
jgi:hypothetical protein